jgi:hypothetical protein
MLCSEKDTIIESKPFSMQALALWKIGMLVLIASTALVIAAIQSLRIAKMTVGPASGPLIDPPLNYFPPRPCVRGRKGRGGEEGRKGEGGRGEEI